MPRASIFSSWWPMVKPLVSRSTLKRLMPFVVPSSTTNLVSASMKSAMCEVVHQILEPFSR